MLAHAAACGIDNAVAAQQHLHLNGVDVAIAFAVDANARGLSSDSLIATVAAQHKSKFKAQVQKCVLLLIEIYVNACYEV